MAAVVDATAPDVEDPELDAYYLQIDIDAQRAALGYEIQAWASRTGLLLTSPDAFDAEDDAKPFARVLSRLRTEYLTDMAATAGRTTAQVSSMVRAIAEDAELRREVFSLARDALGSCSDNLAEGFSKMVLAVDHYRIGQAAARGEIDAQGLTDWAGSLFRLSLLETAVHRHMASRLRQITDPNMVERNNLLEEPLQTMVHAKAELHRSLGLPGSAVTATAYAHLSALAPDQLEKLKQDVQRDAQNPDAYLEFLLAHPTWCAGMQALHPREFHELRIRQDQDPFYDLDLPPDTDVPAQAAYAEKGLRVAQQHAAEERELLLRLAASTIRPPNTETGANVLQEHPLLPLPTLRTDQHLSQWEATEPSSPVSTSDTSESEPADDGDLVQMLSVLGVSEDADPAVLGNLVRSLVEEPDLALRLHGAIRARMEESEMDESGRIVLALPPGQTTRLQAVLDGYQEARLQGTADQLERDIGRQQRPLGFEIDSWAALTRTFFPTAHNFDHEDNAAPFARLLARLREDAAPVPDPAMWEERKAQVQAVLHGIVEDEALRRQVFSLAQDALGSCGDKLAEGFSKIVQAVDSYWLLRAVERGTVNAKDLVDWAASQFRLSLLETAVHRLIDDTLRTGTPEERSRLRTEALETMVHAKVMLRGALGLPAGTVSTMQFQGCSILQQHHLENLYRTVLGQASDSPQYAAFLLGHSTWCAGMKALHPREFAALKARQDEDPFYDLDLPAETDLAAQAAYAERAQRLQRQHTEEECALLLRLARNAALPPAEAGTSRGR